MLPQCSLNPPSVLSPKRLLYAPFPKQKRLRTGIPFGNIYVLKHTFSSIYIHIHLQPHQTTLHIPSSGNHNRLPIHIAKKRTGNGQDHTRGLRRRPWSPQRDISMRLLRPGCLLLRLRDAERDFGAVRRCDERTVFLGGREPGEDVAECDAYFSLISTGKAVLSGVRIRHGEELTCLRGRQTGDPIPWFRVSCGLLDQRSLEGGLPWQ